MIKKSREQFSELPGGIPDTANSEFLRGKIQERNGVIHPHQPASFTKRGFDVWAERSGRTYYSDGSALQGGAMDFASPVSGSGMGKLSSLTGGVKEIKNALPRGVISGITALGREGAKLKGGSVDALAVKEMMQRGANRARGTTGDLGATGGKKPNARAQIVKKIMQQRGVSLPEASKIVKAEGLY